MLFCLKKSELVYSKSYYLKEYLCKLIQKEVDKVMDHFVQYR